MSKSLTNLDYCAAAQKLNCSVAAIKAVASVESAGSGFLPSGKVKILFERHHFSRLTDRRFDASHPQISSRNPGSYFGGENEYQRFSEAYKLAPKAAMMSASWGKFQIMGFNYGVCGFSSVNDFVDAMKRGEGAQLLAFCGFVETNGLDDELRRKDWAGFARGYNGKSYRINRYDEKMLAAYNKFKLENIDCQKFENLHEDEIKLEIPISGASAPEALSINPTERQTAQIMPPPELTQTADQITTETATVEKTDATTTTITQAKNEQDVSQPAEVAAPEPQGVFAKLTGGVSALFSGTIIYTVVEKFSGFTFSQTALILICLVVVLAFLGFLFWAALDAWKQNQRVRLEAEAKTSIDKKDLVWK